MSQTTAEILTWEKLVPALHALPRRNKLWVMQFLLMELAEEEGLDLLTANQAYPVWTPLQADSAAETLLQMLAEDKSE
ncbi:MAG: hypothetical protein GY862_19345 [Gammaproteobacteria bacterium]|nr:hypothetical protein [Gammaproteobacteria bacterium]